MFYEPQYNEALGMTNDITELWDPRFGGQRRSTMYRRHSVMISSPALYSKNIWKRTFT